MTEARALSRRAAVVAAAGLALTALGAALDLRQALFSYLTAWVYWTGIAVGALLLLMAWHASRARWPVVVRRLLEVIPLSLPALAVLFVPIALGMKSLFPWAGGIDDGAAELWRHRRAWMNPGLFLARAAVYFAVWIAVAHLLHAWSVRQDAGGGPELTERKRRLGAGGLPLVALTLSFAAFDWVMSLEAHFASTIFGVYTFAGSFLGAIAVLILAAVAASRRGLLGERFSPDHLHSLGKFLFAFVAFWAYIAFSQAMLIWVANLPHEVPFFTERAHGGWGRVGIFLVLFHFAVPFFVLLSRSVKKRPAPLAFMAAWMLVAHYVDLHWLVMPQLHHAGPAPSWMDLAAFVGVGAAALALAARRVAAHAPVPVNDPYLQDSLRYLPE